MTVPVAWKLRYVIYFAPRNVGIRNTTHMRATLGLSTLSRWGLHLPVFCCILFSPPKTQLICKYLILLLIRSIILVSLFYVTQALGLCMLTAWCSPILGPEDSLFATLEPLLRWQLGLPTEPSLPPYSSNPWRNLVREATTWTWQCSRESHLFDTPWSDGCAADWNFVPDSAVLKTLDEITMIVFIW